MPTSAIQPDVPNAEATEVSAAATPAAETTEPIKSARELALEALEARHQTEMAKANGWELDAEPAPDHQLAAQLAEPEPAPAPVALPQMVKVKTDGVEAEVPLDEVIRNYQKAATADKRLNEATRLLREAEAARLLREQQEQLAAQQEQLAQQHAAAAPPADPHSADGDPVAARKDFLKALFEGDEENALAKLDEMLTAGRQPATAPILDVDQLTQAVTHNVQQKLVVESVLAQNRRDYPQLYADPDMEGLALAKIQRKQREEGIDFFAALDAVSQDMATKFGWTTAPAVEGRPADPAPTTSSRAQKLEQKRTIDNVVSINTKPAPTEAQPEDPSAIIAAMKAARVGA